MRMKRGIDLLNGPIAGSLAKLALPMMGTSLIQMAYNLTDMIWIGRISSNAVAAVGAAGMYMWLSNGLSTLARMGGQVRVAHALGAGQRDEAVGYARTAIQMGLLFGLVYGLIAVVCSRGLIGFFKLNTAEVISDARIYLMITCGGIVFTFLNQILTGLMTAMGNSIVTFISTSIGLVINLFLDPVLIFGIGPFPEMGVAGAAVATVFAQVIVFLVYLCHVRKEPVIFKRLALFTRPDGRKAGEIVKIGFPVALQSTLFTVISMLIARLIAGWGDAAVAVQKVGSQIESISWMTAEGFGNALNAFVAQNYGAGRMQRVRKGYRTALGIVLIWGAFTTAVLILCPQFLFRIFITEPEVIPMGVDYLRILGASQLFMCLEMTAAGAFQGLGRTVPPSATGIVFTSMRIPMAMLLSATALKLNGIWWSISISSIIKGLVLPVWLMLTLRAMRRMEKEGENRSAAAAPRKGEEHE